MTYSYDYEGDEFNIRLGTGGHVQINFEYEVVYIGDVEFMFTDDTLKDIHLRFEGEFLTAQYLIQYFTDLRDPLREECEQEAEDERRMDEELSSVERTGRI